MTNVLSSSHGVATHPMVRNTPTVMSPYATNSAILEKCKEGSNKFLPAFSFTLPRGFPAVDLRRCSTIMGCLTGEGDGIQCSHSQRFDGPHGPRGDGGSPAGERGGNMERIWLSHYPPGIPAEVNVHEFASLKDVLLRSCQRFGALPAYSNMGASMTYAELNRSSRNFAAYLQKSLGLHKGDRVAIMMPNLLQYPVALFGVLRAGLGVVSVIHSTLHPSWSTNSRTRAPWPLWFWKTLPTHCRRCWTRT